MTFYIQPYPYRRMHRRRAAMDGGSTRQGFHLGINVRDEEDTYVLSALVPGLKADDLSIQVLDDGVHRRSPGSPAPRSRPRPGTRPG